MQKYFVAAALLLLALACAQEDISLSKAVALAQNRFPDITVAASSSPNYPAVVGNESYWVVEFDNVWVPVSMEGKIIEGKEALDIFKVHYALQQMAFQRDKDSYPTAKQPSFNAMLSDVTKAKQFIDNYKGDLPGSFGTPTSRLVSSATQLESALDSAGESIVGVRAKETALLNTASSWDGFVAWRTDFALMLDNIKAIVGTGNIYEEDRGDFVKQAGAFAADDGNDITERNTVQSFAANLQIPNVPGAFPELETLVDEWKASWVDVVISDSKLEEDAQLVYTVYIEFGSQSDIVSLRTEAVEKVNSLELKASAIINKLSQCSTKLKASDAASFDELNKSYTKAREAYTIGNTHYSSLDYPSARREYQNAVEYAEDAETEITTLEGVECPAAEKPEPKGIADILIEFLISLPGIAVMALLVAVGGLYWWNKKKGEGEHYDEGNNYVNY